MPRDLTATANSLDGLMFFPVTPLSAEGRVDTGELRAHIAARLPYEPAAVFVACGTGEFFSLTPDEHEEAVAAAVDEVGGSGLDIPVIAGVGYGTEVCAEFTRRAGHAGADGVLVLPPYLVDGPQEGLYTHYRAIAEATSMAVIVYQRNQVSLRPETATRLAQIDNIIGLKDGRGDVENLQRIQAAVGERWVYFNGMPTAELSLAASSGVGFTAYSSAVFSFLPEVAAAFYTAVRTGDESTRMRLLRDFYLPFAELRDEVPGYAVSLVKAGLRVRGEDVGPVRPPLTDPNAEHERTLAGLIERGLELVKTT